MDIDSYCLHWACSYVSLVVGPPVRLLWGNRQGNTSAVLTQSYTRDQSIQRWNLFQFEQKWHLRHLTNLENIHIWHIKHEAQRSSPLQEFPSASSFQFFPRLLWHPVPPTISEERDHCPQVRVKDRQRDWTPCCHPPSHTQLAGMENGPKRPILARFWFVWSLFGNQYDSWRLLERRLVWVGWLLGGGEVHRIKQELLSSDSIQLVGVFFILERRHEFVWIWKTFHTEVFEECHSKWRRLPDIYFVKEL